MNKFYPKPNEGESPIYFRIDCSSIETAIWALNWEDVTEFVRCHKGFDININAGNCRCVREGEFVIEPGTSGVISLFGGWKTEPEEMDWKSELKLLFKGEDWMEDYIKEIEYNSTQKIVEEILKENVLEIWYLFAVRCFAWDKSITGRDWEKVYDTGIRPVYTCVSRVRDRFGEEDWFNKYMKNLWQSIRVEEKGSNYQENVLDRFSGISKNLKESKYGVPGVIGCSFTWMDTPEGQKYWEEIATKLDNLKK